MSPRTLLVDGARWLLFLLFALAAIEKLLALNRRAARWHPIIIVSPWRRRRASELIAASALADVATVTLLLVAPSVGAATSILLLGVYTVAALPVHSSTGGGDCRCFLRIANSRTKRGLLIRNASLLIAAGFLASFQPVGSLGGVLVGGLMMTAVTVLMRLSETRYHWQQVTAFDRLGRVANDQ